jgi:hypothetical protein
MARQVTIPLTSSSRNMSWAKRLLVSLPFVMALTLNILIVAAVRLHWYREHIYGYCFLFATPWAWLLDHIPVGNVHHGWLAAFIGYAVILWIPATLYSGCLWLLLVGPRMLAARRAK